jgi:hypothetical protein
MRGKVTSPYLELLDTEPMGQFEENTRAYLHNPPKVEFRSSFAMLSETQRYCKSVPCLFSERLMLAD